MIAIVNSFVSLSCNQQRKGSKLPVVFIVIYYERISRASTKYMYMYVKIP